MIKFRRTLCILLTLLFTIAGVAYTSHRLVSSTTCDDTVVKLAESDGQNITAKKPRAVTVSDLQFFLMTEVNGVCGQIVEAQTPYKEIEERFKSSNKLVVDRTGKNICVVFSAGYHGLSKGVEAAEGNSLDGDAVLEIYTPAVMNIFEHLKNAGQPKWHEEFRSHLIVLFMHEMEHARRQPPANHVDLDEESRAWADTCKYVIDPLVVKYGLPLFTTEGDLYRAWKDAKGNVDNPVWINAIHNLYGEVANTAVSKGSEEIK